MENLIVGSQEIKDSLPHAANVRYGTAKSQKLDIFGLDTIPQGIFMYCYF